MSLCGLLELELLNICHWFVKYITTGSLIDFSVFTDIKKNIFKLSFLTHYDDVI